MELGQIKYFIMAARYQNLSKAARILNITQPALSKSISNLEDELGIRLFDRLGKKITLNEYGRVFLENVTSTVQELDNAVAATISHVTKPVLHLGLFQQSESFMRCLGRFSEENPNVLFRLDSLRITSRDIDTNEFDMLLYPMNPMFHKYKGDAVYSDPYFLAVHKSSPLSVRKTVRMSDISDQRVIFIKYGRNLFDLPYQMKPDSRICGEVFTNSYEIQRWMISNSHGVGFVPQNCSGAYAADSNITLIPVAEDKLRQIILIGFKREKHLSRDGRSFAAFVRNYFAIEDFAHPGTKG